MAAAIAPMENFDALAARHNGGAAPMRARGRRNEIQFRARSGGDGPAAARKGFQIY
jgi:hypothetical protein